MKFVIIGESGTGKSCLLHHFVRNTFREQSAHTIGVEFASRIVKIGDRRIKLQLWDTAGQERFRSVTRSYYRGAAGVILVFDITRRCTFSPLQRWLDDARALASPQASIVLVGAKCDREEDREVSWDEASRWAAERQLHYLESSSLTAYQTTAPFLHLTRSILLSIESGLLDPSSPGSGVSYGDRHLRLRRARSGSTWSDGDESGRLSVLLMSEEGRGRRTLWFGRGRGGKCC
ncbi:ras-domain-containing protein [Cantharellus anzutake]|uniref:ras-domain-containing protein n=1 Tax=Cantharellus anzutake TaxID=1750568 RepID=UPI001904281E|nr:ras-domain-containing protein [Cantharellus anzutake]XP_038912334.1 ras-domain-containing protein [Cantharellus anzutake]KAF8312410.1 ras-domain-containing protein [Cantharellus anzutake]KAF8325541.1 ras-domain-containing protein [Cantharellus anzutake]